MKILLRWRATVFSLILSLPAIPRLVMPAATSLRTCTSRPVSGPAALRAVLGQERFHARKVDSGAQALKRLARRGEFLKGVLFVSQCPVCQRDQEAAPVRPRRALRVRTKDRRIA